MKFILLILIGIELKYISVIWELYMSECSMKKGRNLSLSM
jgi:hypothetical protein